MAAVPLLAVWAWAWGNNAPSTVATGNLACPAYSDGAFCLVPRSARYLLAIAKTSGGALTVEERLASLESQLARLDTRVNTRTTVGAGSLGSSEAGLAAQIRIDALQRQVSDLTRQVRDLDRQVAAARREASEARREARDALSRSR